MLPLGRRMNNYWSLVGTWMIAVAAAAAVGVGSVGFAGCARMLSVVVGGGDEVCGRGE